MEQETSFKRIPVLSKLFLALSVKLRDTDYGHLVDTDPGVDDIVAL